MKKVTTILLSAPLGGAALNRNGCAAYTTAETWARAARCQPTYMEQLAEQLSGRPEVRINYDNVS